MCIHLSLSLSLYIYIYVCMYREREMYCMCVYIYIYIYIYIHRYTYMIILCTWSHPRGPAEAASPELLAAVGSEQDPPGIESSGASICIYIYIYIYTHRPAPRAARPHRWRWEWHHDRPVGLTTADGTDEWNYIGADGENGTDQRMTSSCDVMYRSVR